MLVHNNISKIGLVLLIAGIVPSCADAAVGTNWIEQWGIQWTFDKPISLNGDANTYRYGQFANGDYWIVGPIRITKITPQSIASTDYGSGPRIINGSMLNPSPVNGKKQGYDSEMHRWASTSNRNNFPGGEYQESLNVARKNNLPIDYATYANYLDVPVNSSLVSAISKSAPDRAILNTAAVLTVLSTPAAANSFRPPYSGTNKEVLYSADTMNYGALKNLTPVTGVPTWASVEKKFERVWLDHVPAYWARYCHPELNMEDYSQFFSEDIGDAALLLNLNYSNTQKKKLLISLVQLGIDNYRNIQLGSALAEGNWVPNEGQNMGRKFPIVFAGLILNSNEMLHVGKWNPGIPVGQFNPVFQEDLNIFKVAQSDVGRPLNGVNVTNAMEYTQAHVGLPEWGSRHYGPAADPSRDNAEWNAPYRDICGTGMAATALAAMLIGIDRETIWENNLFFSYMDRWWKESNNGQPDVQVLSSFARQMWLTYRTTCNRAVWIQGMAPENENWSGTNNSPSAVNDSFTVQQNSSNNALNVLTNDSDSDGDILTISAVTQPAHGQAVISSSQINYTPSTGYSGTDTFTYTISDGRGKSATASVTITVSASVPTYTLTITAVNGTVTKSPNKTTYTSGETVTLTAAANTGYSFSNWTGDITGTTNPTSVTINSNRSVTANFSQTTATMPTDTVYQNTTDMTFNTTNTYQNISTTGWNLNGTTATLWINPDNLTGTRYLLGHTVGTWSNRVQLYLNNNALCLGMGGTHSSQTNIATFQTGQWYFVSLYWNGTNYTVQVNNQIMGTGTYTGLTSLNTSADIGNNGNSSDRTEPFSGIIDDVRIYGRALSNAEISAVYNYGRTTSVPTTYTLSATAANGSVTRSPNTATYTYGQTVTLTATPDTGYSFGNWTGDATGTTNPVTITMNGNKSVTANFTQNTYTLAITAANGAVTKSPNTATYTYGQTVTLTAAPNAGYSFSNWTGSAIGTNNPITITMNGNKSVTANFTQNTYTLAITSTNGTVAKSPNTATYTYGQIVTLSATPNAGYYFVSWSDGLTGSTNPATLTMNGNKSVTANYGALSLDLSMTAHWMLDENTGTAITDCGSSGRTAALINNPSWGFAWADEHWVSLENQTQAIAIPANALQPQAGAIALWVEPDSLAGTQFILGHVFNSSNRINLYSVAGKLALGLGSNIALQTNIADLTVGQPAHIVLTWNGTAYAVYVDTVLKASGTFEGLTDLNATLDVGNYGDASNRTVGFIGVIDDIRTYCRALTSTEIQRLYYTYDVYQQKLVSFSIPTAYQPSILPTGATFASGVFSWRPWYNQVGNYTIVFTASGQPIRVVTITVHPAAMTDWYRQFLVHTEKLQ